MIDIWLASKSPRRRELLQQLGVRFDVVSVDVAERIGPGESAGAYVARLAVDKAQAGAETRSLVLGADTIVVLADRVLEKPKDLDHFKQMFELLSGKTHQVMTAIALCRRVSEREVKTVSRVCVSDVTFRAISAAEAHRYWQTGEPRGKAGGYGIQGFGAAFVTRLEGSYSNVVGLPLHETSELLAPLAVPIWNPL